jgi:hypothetical protein
MVFTIYNAANGGANLWQSPIMPVNVRDGLFTVKLAIDPTDFNGQALWLQLRVNGENLSPRQEILPAPYALGLRPGARVFGDQILPWEASISGYAPATGTALYADANGGTGVFGDSENSYGVWGSSNNSNGGYFTSSGGYGIRVDTTGSAHYDHGAYITADAGYGVLAQSATNQGVRGEGGDVNGIAQPLGAVGVVGIGQNRGTYGSSNTGVGVYGVSSTNYGMWGASTTWYGVTGRTSNANNNYGFYTPDNLYSANINLSGAIMQVMQNGGSEPLSPGEVVLFSGIDQSVTAVDGPIVQVRRAETANSTAVAGVVFSRFNIDAIDPALASPDSDVPGWQATMEVTPDGSAAPGEYLLVVVQGPAPVKIDSASTVQPGDLLSTSVQAGMANKAAMVTINGVEMAVPGTVFGKALAPVDGSDDMIYVYVTLQ